MTRPGPAPVTASLGLMTADLPAASEPTHRSACMYAAGLPRSAGQPTARSGQVTSRSAALTGKSAEDAGERRLLRTCRRRTVAVVKTPQKEKPKHLVQRRNARERRRVHAVNLAFCKLSRALPHQTRGKRVSKVKTLQRAIDYIDYLRLILQRDDQRLKHSGTGCMQIAAAVVGDDDNSWSSYSQQQQVVLDGYYTSNNDYNMQYSTNQPPV